MRTHILTVAAVASAGALLSAPVDAQPDLVPYPVSGWDYPIVPSDAENNGVLQAGPLPADLPVVINYGWGNLGDEASGSYLRTLYQGGIVEHEGLLGSLDAGYLLRNFFERTLSGRRTLRLELDRDDRVAESDETNNQYARQFIWDGALLSDGIAESRPWVPQSLPIGGGPWFDSDGFKGNSGSGYWYAFAVMPDPDRDFDIRLHTEHPSNIPMAGWGPNVAESQTIGDGIDYVVVDRNHAGPGPYYAGVVEFASGGQKRVEFEEDDGVLVDGVNGPFTMEPGNLIGLHELSVLAGARRRVQVQWLDGSADFGLAVLDGMSTYHARGSELAVGDRNGARQDEYVVIDPDANDFVGILVYKERPEDVPRSLTYNILVDDAPNLASHTLTGWPGPVVPRATGDTAADAAPLPAELPGNAPETYFNWAEINQGPGDLSASFETHLFVDDELRWLGFYGSLADGQATYVANTPIGGPASLVRGGRHYVLSWADATDEVTEADEGDNRYAEGFVWTPLIVGTDVPVTRPAPPVRWPILSGAYPACDGFRMVREPNEWWSAVGITPLSETDEYDCHAYAASTGSQSGFDLEIAVDASLGGGTALVAVNHNTGIWSELDFGAIRYTDGGADFVVHRTKAGPTEDLVEIPTPMSPLEIAPGEILAVQEVLVSDDLLGTSIPVTLQNVSGGADLAVAVFTPGTVIDGEGLAFIREDSADEGENESFSFPVVAGGYHGFVVYKTGAADLPANAFFRLYFGDITVDVNEVPSAAGRLALHEAHPNPFASSTTLRFDVPHGAERVWAGVFDTGGRLVRTLADDVFAEGAHDLRWDGQNQLGVSVHPGVYFVRLRGDAGTVSRKVVRTR